MNREHLTLLQSKIPYLFNPGSALYVGASHLRCEGLADLHAAGREITLVEAWPDNADFYRSDRRIKRVINADITEYSGYYRHDVVFWWHGPEHIEADALPRVLGRLEQLAGQLVVLGCPWGHYQQGASYGNPYEHHLASLYPSDFEALGYRTATLGEPDRDGLLVAWKYIRPRVDKMRSHVPHVVMVTHGDRLRYLKQSIPALLRTDWPMSLTVVANAPGSGARAYLDSQANNLTALMVSRRNAGKPIAANAGWRLRPDAQYVIIFDDDVLATDPDWLRKLVDIADSCPEVGVVGHSLEHVSWSRRVLTGPGGDRRTVQVQPGNISSACMLIPRRTYELCGRFDEELPKYGEEDALYCWRVRLTGRLCVYFDDADLGRSCVHLGEDDAPGYRRWKDKQRSRAIPIRDRLHNDYRSGKRPLDYNK